MYEIRLGCETSVLKIRLSDGIRVRGLSNSVYEAV
jgi:hypothetical protein